MAILRTLILFIPFYFILGFYSTASSTSGYLKDSVIVLTLNEIIDLALQQSPEYYYSVNLKENKYWQWRRFQSNYMPQVALSGTLPDYYRSYIPVTQQDGTIQFKLVSNSISDVSLNLKQTIGFTGGYIFAGSQLRRSDNFRTSGYEYSGNPVIVGINQPVFGYNSFFWDKKIEPLKYEESRKEYAEKLEQISLKAAEHFFSVLLAQISLSMASKNRANSDTIFKIAQTKFELGKIAENELLQIRLSWMNTKQAVSRAQLDLETSTLRLKIFVGITDNLPIKLILPDSIPEFEIDEELAVLQARKNRSDIIGFKRKLLEAKRDIALAKSNNGLKANLYATYGLTNKSNEIPPVYKTPMDQQSVKIGFEIPIVDWGRSRANMKTALANQKLVQNTVHQEELNFDQEVYTVSKQVKMLGNQIEDTQISDQIAQRRYEISKNKYLVGKIGITDLNIALQEKDQAKYSYFQALHDFWTQYYNLRVLTLYDFQRGAAIEY